MPEDQKHPPSLEPTGQSKLVAAICCHRFGLSSLLVTHIIILLWSTATNRRNRSVSKPFYVSFEPSFAFSVFHWPGLRITKRTGSLSILTKLCLNAAVGRRNGAACVSLAWGGSLKHKGLQFLNTEGEKVTHFPGWFSFPSQPPDYFSVSVAVRLQLIRLLERATMAKKCAWGGILLWNLQAMHYLMIGAALHRQTDAKTVLDVENIQHLPQFSKDTVFFLSSYQSRLLNICLFLINMRSFCISSSTQLSSMIRTAKKNNQEISFSTTFQCWLTWWNPSSELWAMIYEVKNVCPPSQASLHTAQAHNPYWGHRLCCLHVCQYHCGQINSKLPSQKKFSLFTVLLSDQNFPWDNTKSLAWGPGFGITCLNFVFA